MGAEQHGNLSSVGFDLFTQMLGQAVAEARGDDDAGVEAASVGINLPADYFLSEEYMPAVDQRVLVYRKLAAAEDLESVDEVQEETGARTVSCRWRGSTCSIARVSVSAASAWGSRVSRSAVGALPSWGLTFPRR